MLFIYESSVKGINENLHGRCQIRIFTSLWPYGHMMHPTLSFFIQLLETLEQKKITIVSLRYKPLQERVAFSGDYDFVTSESAVNSVLEVLFDLASASQVNFVINRVKYGKFVISLFSPTDTRPIVMEIWTYLDVKYEKTLGHLFWEDIEPHIIYQEGQGYTLSLELEALYYLSHLKTKKKVLTLPLIRERLDYYSDALKAKFPEYKQWYAALIEDSSLLIEIGTKANYALVDKKVLFTKSDRQKAAQEKKLRLQISLHRIYSQWLRRVKVIPVVGPDGVGKTSIIEALKSRSKSKIKYYRFKNLFRHNFLYQVTYPFLQKKLANKVEKNQYDDIYGSWMITIAFLRFPLLIIATLFGKRFFFSDRFFHDFIIKDTRFLGKKAVLRENWKELLKKTPRTFWFLHLDAPTDVILARKQELNADAIDSYRKDVFRMYLEKPSRIYSYINTANAIEVCADVLMQTAGDIGIKSK